VIHELPLERRTLHGHFSRDLEPVLEIDPGDSVAFSTIDAGWGLEGGPAARQGDGEVCQLAIEAPMEHVRLTLDLRSDLELAIPVVWTPEAWVTLGLAEDLDEAAALAVDGMLDLMGREHGFERRDAYALASVVVDLNVTQVVKGVKGVHAVLRHDAIRI